jgi:hypothetical protein
MSSKVIRSKVNQSTRKLLEELMDTNPLALWHSLLFTQYYAKTNNGEWLDVPTLVWQDSDIAATVVKDISFPVTVECARDILQIQ